MPPATPNPLSDTFAAILDGLCRAVAARMPRSAAALPLLLLLWSRLRRTMARFATLAKRVRAGALPARRTTRRRPAPASRPRDRLPEGFAWLVRLVPEAAAYGQQLQHLLSTPEMQAILAAAPQAGRMLRPLCRMLAVTPTPALPPPPRPPRQAASRPAAPAGTRSDRATAAAEPRAAGLASFRLPRRPAPA